ncbi:DUF1688 family protein [Amorphus orientalis]|uniref:Uracil phosphoribosyltransferase n=1 Tax=Amorphus orientalis TaxID=649198 RepID=A0AAE4AW48_9HYPH|nr:DUF1688 family protein [Amorphus orientalis]MDQ0317384.1 hypothetical protein [Amorphus orientalis]
MTAEREAYGRLMRAGAVRERSARLFALAEEGGLPGLTLHLDRMDEVAARVAAVTQARFPDLSVSLHSRWRHFEAGGLDRWGMLAGARGFDSPRQAARAAADLAVVSVLLDAGAGSEWHYREALTGETHARSEGLAIASLAMFAGGLFSGVPADPLRADAVALAAIGEDELASGLQVSPDNPIVGLSGRTQVLARLAHAMENRRDLFAVDDDPRPGGLIDALIYRAEEGRVPAATILDVVLDGLTPAFPGRLELAGMPLGDTWRHPSLSGEEPGADLVPFHKLSTWLALSLIEPLDLAGVEVTDLDGLPGLAEYRNGGLFIDGGVISLADPDDAQRSHPVDSPLIVGWRALTVCLLDVLAEKVRGRLDVAPSVFPLACVLEGGSWAAGRAIALERRADAGPPLRVDSDGTVF